MGPTLSQKLKCKKGFFKAIHDFLDEFDHDLTERHVTSRNLMVRNDPRNHPQMTGKKHTNRSLNDFSQHIPTIFKHDSKQYSKEYSKEYSWQPLEVDPIPSLKFASCFWCGHLRTYIQDDEIKNRQGAVGDVLRKISMRLLKDVVVLSVHTVYTVCTLVRVKIFKMWVPWHSGSCQNGVPRIYQWMIVFNISRLPSSRRPKNVIKLWPSRMDPFHRCERSGFYIWFFGDLHAFHPVS